MKKDQVKRKIGIEFSLPDASVKHCSGIEAMHLTPGKLFTASRDGTIKRWNLSSASPTFEVSLEGHTDWINDLAHLPQHDLLASCSNDSTVRLWKASSDEAGGKVLHCLQYHSDYVTCLSAAPDKGLLCSAGLRGEVFTIDPETSTAHQMYPKSSSNQDRHASSRMGGGILGNPAHPPSAFSRFSSNLWGGGGGGADSRDDSQQDPSGSHTSSMTAAAKLKKQKGSIYALSCSPDGALIAFGGTDHIVRLWDPRTKTKVDKLRGHSDTLRALHLSPGDQGRQALSASSDGTVRLWDVGMRRCIESYCIHTDSVWCLAPSHDFSQVYSGGRDGYVFVTQLKGSHTPHHPHPNPHASTSSSLSYLVAKESKPIRCLALEAFPPATGAGGGGGGKSEAELKVWVGTESSHIHQYASPSTSTSISSSTLASTPARSNQPSPSPSPLDPNKNIQIRIETTTIPPPTFRRKSSMNGTPVKQLGDQAGPKPVWTIPGLPAIVKQKVLNDRRHVLTLDSEGKVSLWDVLTGGVVESYGQVDFNAKEKELFEPLSVPPWFQPDIRMGRLNAVLEPPSCFFAEEYASSIGGCEQAEDDEKVNLGRLMLEGAFLRFKQNRAASHRGGAGGSRGSRGSRGGVGEEGEDPQPGPFLNPAIPWPKYWTFLRTSTSSSSPSSPSSSSPELIRLTEELDRVPHILGQNAAGMPWRLKASCFTGAEEEHLPPWVVDVVVREVPTAPKESKCPFILMPMEGSGLPQLKTSRLNAPRILQVHKVYTYCQARLRDERIEFAIKEPPTVGEKSHGIKRPSPSSKPGKEDEADEQEDSSPSTSPSSSSHNPNNLPYLEILCNGQGVPYDMNLASVRAYLWKKPSEDLVFQFRRLDPRHPAPMPVILPPANS